jgi:uncharacterized RDD family membrane protein YckC
MPIRRLFGFLYDLILMICVTQIIAVSLAKDDDDVFGMKGLLGFGMGMVFFLLKDAINGQSMGKWAFCLQVKDKSGRPIGITKSVLRNVTSFVWPLELIAIAVTARNVRLTDYLLSTNVHYVENRPGKTKRYGIAGLALMAFLIMDFSLMHRLMINDGSTDAVKRGIVFDRNVTDEIGEIKDFGFFKQISINGNQGYFYYSVKTENGKYNISSLIEKKYGKWQYTKSKVEK